MKKLAVLVAVLMLIFPSGIDEPLRQFPGYEPIPPGSDTTKSARNDAFGTLGEAMFHMASHINAVSIATNQEYGGIIFVNQDGSYGYSLPIRGINNMCFPALSPIPYEARKIGYYHTHGRLESESNLHFSDDDIMLSFIFGRIEVLVNPRGELKIYVPYNVPFKNENYRLATIYPWEHVGRY
ncbi:MAG TPA: DUF4329 domain-containing protein [Syntrophobacter fumaroxidans]|nr:DUF4329 domain-containing protein [Syntrophobacter fumaroxidans]